MTDPTYRHIFKASTYGKKGSRCEILRGKGILAQIRFEDGLTVVVNRMTLRRAKPSELKTLDANGVSESILSLSPTLPEDNHHGP